jgi:hypothetical protein
MFFLHWYKVVNWFIIEPQNSMFLILKWGTVNDPEPVLSIFNKILSYQPCPTDAADISWVAVKALDQWFPKWVGLLRGALEVGPSERLWNQGGGGPRKFGNHCFRSYITSIHFQSSEPFSHYSVVLPYPPQSFKLPFPRDFATKILYVLAPPYAQLSIT